MTVREIMTSNPQCCTPETSLQDVGKMMDDCDCGAIPVVESTSSMKPVGVITDRDIVVRVVATGEDCRNARAQQAMSTSTVSARPDQDLRDAERTMMEHQIRRLVVVDDSGRCVGILAQADIARRRSERETGDLVEEISEPAAAF